MSAVCRAEGLVAGGHEHDCVCGQVRRPAAGACLALGSQPRLALLGEPIAAGGGDALTLARRSALGGVRLRPVAVGAVDELAGAEADRDAAERDEGEREHGQRAPAIGTRTREREPAAATQADELTGPAGLAAGGAVLGLAHCGCSCWSACSLCSGACHS